jgi:predicted dehydrogenase/threonine dehydrogenase-like Zn-dependent dehydrogenase
LKQVLQSYRTGELSVAEVPAPGIEPGCLLVLTKASLVSVGTDRGTLELSQKSLLGKARERPDLVRKVLDRLARDGLVATGRSVLGKLDQPIPLGYSCAGEVVAVGEGVSGFAVGDRVACAGARVANHAELNLVPVNLCARVPEGVADETAAFATLGAVALQGLRQAAPTLGETFAVIGLGLVGQLTVQLLKANGCAVLGIDLDPVKVDLARALGADVALLRADAVADAARALTRGRGVDGVLICAATASSDPIALAGELCRDRGRVVAVGAVGMEVPRRPWFDKELTLLQSRSYGPGRYDPAYEERGQDYPLGYVRWTEGRNLEAFLALCAKGSVRTAELVTHRFAIEQAQLAYETVTRENPIAVVLTYPRGAAPSRTVRLAEPRPRAGAPGLAVLGAGAFASGTLLPLLEGARLVGIASARGASARHLATRFHFERATTDEQELLRDPDVDAVFILTRHSRHAAQAIAALAAGKHVFVEKPPALNEPELAALLEAARASGRVLMPGYNRRFAPLALELRQHFAARTAPLVIQVRVNAGPLPQDHWLHDPREGGRIVGEACHFVDLCAFLCGALPQSVYALGAGDDVSLTLRFGDGSIATIAYVTSSDASAGKERVEVLGDGAYGLLDDFRRLELRRGGARTASRGRLQDKGHRAEIQAFRAALQSGASPVSLEELAAVSRATFAALESLRLGEPVRLA